MITCWTECREQHRFERQNRRYTPCAIRKRCKSVLFDRLRVERRDGEDQKVAAAPPTGPRYARLIGLHRVSFVALGSRLSIGIKFVLSNMAVIIVSM